METIVLVGLGLILAAALGYGLALLLARGREARLAAELSAARATLEAERRGGATVKESFAALASEVLAKSQQSLMGVAKSELEARKESVTRSVEETLKPVAETLQRLNEQVRQVEKERSGAYAGLTEQVKGLFSAQELLREQAAGLVAALRQPTVRGRWGEMQLKRVVELAGMLEHCDFEEQATTYSPEGAARPDLVVHLTGGKKVVVDAKAPLAAYLDAAQATDPATRTAKLKDFLRQVRTHVEQLGGKAYWERIRPTPEFVVMFLPGEAFLAAALEQDPALIEAAMARKVVLAGPTVLIPLLSVVAWGWKQERMAKSQEEVARLGGELHRRLRTLTEHFARVGSGLETAVKAYNETAASLESRVLVTARQLKEHQVASGEELPVPRLVEGSVRPLERGVQGGLPLREAEGSPKGDRGRTVQGGLPLELPHGVKLPVVTEVR